MTRSALLAAALLLGAACSSDPAGSGATSFPAAALTRVSTLGGAFDVEVRTAPDQPPSRGLVSVEYRITTPGGAPVDGLDLAVVPYMPAMGHGASTKPTVSAEGGGRYVITGVELFMPGTWELRTQIKGTLEDSAAPSFEIP
jgi:hypothetical protein